MTELNDKPILEEVEGIAPAASAGIVPEIIVTAEEIAPLLEGDNIPWEKLRELLIVKGIDADALDEGRIEIEQNQGSMKVRVS